MPPPPRRSLAGWLSAAILLLVARDAPCQTAQVGAVPGARAAPRLVIDHVGYRAARWEHEAVVEPEDDEPNRGGIVSAYVRNVSDAPVRLRFWRLNGRDESLYRVDRLAVWDRTFHTTLPPGATTVVEINGRTADFGPGGEFRFAWVDDSWEEVGGVETRLEEDDVQVAFIRLHPDRATLDVVLRQSGSDTVELGDLGVVGRPAAEPAAWTSTVITGPGLSIGRVVLAAPIPSGELVVVNAAVTVSGVPRRIFAHRRAFADRFPIGTWGAAEPLRERLHRMHIDTAVVNGRRSDGFFGRDAARFGMQAMVHTGIVADVDLVRDLSASPHVACWMLQDEPDWSIPPSQVLLAEQTVRAHDSAHPTMVTLCRNVRFFEYAPIVDIPCMDHYCVTAPSSSRWPHPWGTRLEETAFYTRDLKAAAEPRPVWVWTQGLARWTERPARPVPTVAELSAQFVLNLSRGAKGILWFNFSDELGTAYPDVHDAMAGWSRVLTLLREDLLGAEPCPRPTEAPASLDARLLVGRDAALLCLANLDYEITPECHVFRERSQFAVSFTLPAWLRPTRALRLDHTGPAAVGMILEGDRCTVNLDRLIDAAVVFLPNDEARIAEAEGSWAGRPTRAGGPAE